MLPNDLKTLKGTVTQFKNKIESFISIFWNKPHVDGISMGATSLEGDPSNSLHDWIRILDWDWSLDSVTSDTSDIATI